MYKGLEVYEITRDEYIKYRYFMDDEPKVFYIITDEGVLVHDNLIVGDIYRGVNGEYNVDTRLQPITYFKYKLAFEPHGYFVDDEEDEDDKKAEEYDAADELLNSVYKSKLWED